MNDFNLIFLVIVIAVTILVIRYIVSLAVHRSADAIENAYKKNKNKNKPTQNQNLSDRYNNDSFK